MSDTKKYYYMRLKENFFESEALILLESMPDGILYSNILIKMYLKSLKNEGRLMFNEYIPYNPQMIATVTRHQVGTVEKALDIFEQLGLIDILTNGAIYMNDIQLFIGKSSTEGERKRAARLEIEKEKLLLSGQMSDERPPEKEIELEIEKEIEIKKDNIPYADIVDYLNLQVGSNYKSSTKKTRDLIKARWKEGFTLEDFKQVIDIKTKEWVLDNNMRKYLRPETLFGNKFESYLNQKGGNPPNGPKEPERNLLTKYNFDKERELKF